MIKRCLMVLMSIAFVLSIVVIVARAAPAKQKAFTSPVAIEMVSPSVVNVPVITGYDVIQTFTIEPRGLSIVSIDSTVTMARRGLSPTVDWRSSNRPTRHRNGFGRIEPVLLL